MKKEFAFSMDENVYRRLRELCKDDENAMREYVAKALEKQISLENQPSRSNPADLQGLEDYLKSGDPGSRAYGIKGQGW